MKARLLSLLHLIIIVIAYSSPLWLDWKLFFIGLMAYYIQLIIFRGCLLTFAQYGTFKESYSARLFSKILNIFGLNVQRKTMQVLLKYYFPIFLILLCIIWQVIFKMPILVRLN